MDAYRLSMLVGWALPEFFEVDGFLFVKDRDDSLDELRKRVASHASPGEAQRWMNIVLLNDIFDELIGSDWDETPAIIEIVELLIRTWMYQVEARFPHLVATVEKVNDEEYGDYGLRLTNVVR